MEKKIFTITITIKNVEEFHDDPKAYAILLADGTVIYLPKAAGMEVATSDQRVNAGFEQRQEWNR